MEGADGRGSGPPTLDLEKSKRTAGKATDPALSLLRPVGFGSPGRGPFPPPHSQQPIRTYVPNPGGGGNNVPKPGRPQMPVLRKWTFVLLRGLPKPHTALPPPQRNRQKCEAPLSLLANTSQAGMQLH